MNIAILTPNFPPENGACASRIARMNDELTQAGHETLIITAVPNYPTGKFFKHYANNNPKILHFFLYPSHSFNIFKRLLSVFTLSVSVLFALPRLKKFKPHIVFVQSPPLPLALSAYWLSYWCKAHFILNISDLYPNALIDLKNKISQKSVLFRLAMHIEHFLYTKSDLIIGQSNEILTHIGAIVPQKKMILYRTGVNISRFYPPEKTQQNPIFKIVYAGLLGAAQDLLGVCEHIDFKALGIELHLYGDGGGRAAIAHFLDKHNNCNIFLHAPLPHADVPDILRQHDAALVAQRQTIYGTVPSKIYEAMACGLPVLLCGGGEAAQILTAFGTGLVANTQDYPTLQENMRILKNMTPAQRQNIGNEGYEAAKKYFADFLQKENLLNALKNL